MTVEAALIQAAEQLGTSSTAQLDAEVLLAHALRTDRTWVLANGAVGLPPQVEDHFRDLVSRRRSGTPVAYLTRTKEFRGRPFEVTPSVLVPRPESELLVDLTVAQAMHGDSVVDIGTGSGCLGISIALERPDLDVHLVDLSAVALSQAADNAAKLGASRVRLHRADLWPELGLDPARTVIVANLPYVPDATVESDQSLRAEPRMALAGGPDGLDVIRRFLAELDRRRFYPRLLLLEHGHDQADALASLFEYDPTLHRDLAGHPRVSQVGPAHFGRPAV